MTVDQRATESVPRRRRNILEVFARRADSWSFIGFAHRGTTLVVDAGATLHRASFSDLRIDAADWWTPDRLVARAALRERANDVFGQGVEVTFSFRSDAEREPPDYVVVSVVIPASTTAEKLVEGEEALIEYLMDEFGSVEDDFVLVCRRLPPANNDAV